MFWDSFMHLSDFFFFFFFFVIESVLADGLSKKCIGPQR